MNKVSGILMLVFMLACSIAPVAAAISDFRDLESCANIAADEGEDKKGGTRDDKKGDEEEPDCD